MSVAERKKAQLDRLKMQKLYDQGQKDGIENAIWLMLWSLHTKQGYGKKRLTDVYTEIVKQAECLISGNLDMADIRNALREECGICAR